MTNNEIELSVIIPCFNAESYIEECLNSVIPYSHGMIEAIIVNDGSTDNSSILIEKIISSFPDSNVTLIQQDNGGVSLARNEGIKIAKGKYICFLDADDFYNNAFWKIIPQTIKDNDFDILEFNGEQFEGSTKNIIEHINSCAINGNVDIFNYKALAPAFKRCKWYPWARVFKRTLFDGVCFPVGKLYEDMITIPQLYVKSTRIIGLNVSLVWYRFHKKSITQTFRKKDISDLAFALNQYAEMVSKSNDKKELIKVVYPAVHRTYNLIKYSIVNNQCRDIETYDIEVIRESLMVFIKNFKLSKRIQIYFLPFYIRTILLKRRS
jgi:glycosyltransferase involved in cell wall biosynthesis